MVLKSDTLLLARQITYLEQRIPLPHSTHAMIADDHRHDVCPPPCLHPYNWVSSIVIVQQQW